MIDCYCGKGFKVRKSSSLLFESVQLCSVNCVQLYIQENKKPNPRYLKSNIPVFDFGGVVAWDYITDGYYRSKFEMYFARFLADINEPFQYEPTTLHIGRKKYVPDFWLPHLSSFFEIKGFWGAGAKTKTRKTIKAGHPLVLIPNHLSYGFRKKYKTKFDW